MLHRTVAILVAFLSFAVAVDVGHAFAPNDAGSGRDAGNTKSDALYLPKYGSFEGDLASASDDDWYWRPDLRDEPVCVSATFQPDGAVKTTLRLSTPKGTRTVTTSTPAGGTNSMGIAVPSLYLSRVAVLDGPAAITHYGFSLAPSSLPSPSAGDAGLGIDAGSTVATALPTSDPCVGGNLAVTAGITDTDLYAIAVSPGETLYYSIASTSADVVAKLTDASGQLLGPAAGPGDLVGVYLPDGGTYYMSASSSSVTSVPYVLGLIAGAEPPTSPCRPYCVVLE